MVNDLEVYSVETTMYVDCDFEGVNHKYMVITSFTKRTNKTIIKDISKIYNGTILKKKDNKNLIKEITKYLGYE